MPSGCARASAVTSARVSQGNSGRDADTARRRATSEAAVRNPHLAAEGFSPTPGRSRSGPPWRHRLAIRSEEHTSELQSQSNLVCRLLLEKKKKSTNLRKFPQ